jgi:cytochrome c553
MTSRRSSDKRHRTGKRVAAGLGSLSIAAVVAAAGGSFMAAAGPVTWPRSSLVRIAAAASAQPPPGAAACSGCHPASAKVSSPVPRLVGLDRAAIVRAMQEFRAGTRPATVMDRIAKGFTDEEVQAIAAWYAGQR